MAKIIVRLNPDVPPTGSDLGFVNAARRSFNSRSDWEYFTKGELDSRGNVIEYVKLKDKDKRLLEFLARGMTAKDFDEFCSSIVDLNEFDRWDYWQDFDIATLKEKLWQWRNTPTHDTPFNHGFISFEVKAPVFVRAQLVKHEYLILSEFSRRYITDGIEFYHHEYREAPENKKQGSGGKHPLWNHGVGTGYMEDVYEHYNNSVGLYLKMLDDGVAPEEARGVLPQDVMTEWTWSGTPGAFFKMCQLRLAPDAQYETRLVAQKVYNELCKAYPVSAPLMVKGVF